MSTPDNTIKLFTAAQIAKALAEERHVMKWALRGVRSAGLVMVNGQAATGWAFAALPVAIQERLLSRAESLGYRNAEHLLSDPAGRWEPAAGLHQVSQGCRDKAERLRNALRRYLALEDKPPAGSNELERVGLQDYEQQFGWPITGRYLRELVSRIKARDRGAKDYERLELYLPERPTPEAKPSRRTGVVAAGEFEALAAAIARFRDPAAPSEAEKSSLWLKCFRLFDEMVDEGHSAKKLRRRLLGFLGSHTPALARSNNALRVAFDYKYKTWLEKGRAADALADHRKSRCGQQVASPIPQADIDILVAHTAWNCGGRVAQGVREMAQMGERSGLTPDTLQVLARPHARKSYVNARLLAPLSKDVKLIAPYLLGRKAVDDATAWLRRDYSKLRPMDVITADDYTMPIYAYVPDGAGWYILTRGQCLLFIDCRTLKILGWSLQPERNYNSLVIRSIDNKVCRQWGVPRVKHFERGIWKNSKVVKNAAPVGWGDALSGEDHDFGWEQLGVRIIHTTRARSKLAELVGGLIQNLMERVPGYCGRDERRDCPEVTKRNKLAVEGRRVEPAGLFLSFEEWDRELARLVEWYNTTPQEGRILDGLSPDAAMQKFWPHEDPPTPFEGSHQHLLAHYVSRRPVTANGVCFKIGKEPFIYRDEQTGRLREGEDVLAWFDPENPEQLGVTDLNQRNPILVPRDNAVDFLASLDKEGADGQLYKEELAKAAGHNRYAAARYHVLKEKFKLSFRTPVVSPRIAEVGRAFEDGRRQHQEEQKEKTARVRTIRDRARKLGLPTSILRDGPESGEGLKLMLDAKRAHEQRKKGAQPISEETV